MQFDPRTNELFTDDGTFVRRLHCPRQAEWDELQVVPRAGERHCVDCRRPVFDTATMTDAELIALMEWQPAACLAVSPKQQNCTVRPNFR